MKTVLVLNMGMKSIRSIIFNQKGEQLSCCSRPIQTMLTETTVTQNPDEWWEKARIVIRESMSVNPELKIDYITVTASSSALVCIDETGKSLYPCFMVSDRRAAAESRYLTELSEFIPVKAATSLEMNSSLMIPKILWVKTNKPEIYRNTFQFLSPNDYFIYLMSGVSVTDYMNAQKYHYNVKTMKYPHELLKKIGIMAEKLPKVTAPGTVIGNILDSVAVELGLNEDCQLVVSTYDAVCSFIGSGVMEEGEVSDVSGTVTVLRALTYMEKELSTNMIGSIPYFSKGIHIVGGSNNLGGGLIEWVKQCYYQKEEYPYEIMEKEAGEVGCGAGGLIFLPYLLGERVPIWDQEARGVFFGLERVHTRKEMTRAVYESAGYIDLDIIEAIENEGIEIPHIRISGGLARINLISQLKADILGKEAWILSEFETTSTGAAMIALEGAGVLSGWDEAVQAFVSVRMIIKPNFNNHKIYQKMHGLYQETYRTLKPLFAKRMRLVEETYDNKITKIENL